MSQPSPDEPSIDRLLRNWTLLNDYLRYTTNPSEIRTLLQAAIDSRSRRDVVQRIYQRFSKLRWANETAFLDRVLLQQEGDDQWEFPPSLQ